MELEPVRLNLSQGPSHAPSRSYAERQSALSLLPYGGENLPKRRRDPSFLLGGNKGFAGMVKKNSKKLRGQL